MDDISAYDSVHGMFIYDRRTYGFKDVACRAEQKNHNEKFPNNRKAKSSRLTGLLKCSHCVYSIQLNFFVRNLSLKDTEKI